MNAKLQEKATAILEAARTREMKAEPIPCRGCGIMQALPESSTHRVSEPIR
ncbi:MAG: hypothetical protein ACXU86_09250 [Archangium sp.]